MTIPDSTLVSASKLSERYITDRFLPDKAIDVIDEAGARARLAAQAPPPEVAALKAELEKVNGEKEAAVRDQNFERAASLRDKEREIQGDIKQKQEEWEARRQSHRPVLGEEEIAFIVSRWTGIPVTRLQEAETARLLRMEDELHETVIGQDEAIKAISKAIRRSRAGLKDPRRPIGSFVFSRPDGRRQDGAGALAGEVPVRRRVGADSRRHERVHGEVLRVAAHRRASGLRGLRGFGHAHQGGASQAVQRDPARRDREGAPGRVQHPAPGARRGSSDRQLRPCDRLQEHGRDHDVERRRARPHARPRRLASRRATTRQNWERRAEKVRDELKNVFNPEFLNRLDDVIVFHPLSREHIAQIVGVLLKDVRSGWRRRISAQAHRLRRPTSW